MVLYTIVITCSRLHSYNCTYGTHDPENSDRMLIAERISDRQIIVQQVWRYSRVLVCMYVCIYVRKKFRIVDCGFSET